MEHFDVAIIGIGPAGSALARKLAGKMQVIALDKKHQCGTEGFSKPCGGLLAPDAQRSFIRDGLTLPVDVIANPQIFSVKTVDVAASLTRNYQRSYININRHAFDLWMKSLIPPALRFITIACAEKSGVRMINGMSFFVQTAGSNILPPAIWSVPMAQTRWCGDISTRIIKIRKYVAIQQWFAEKHPVPFYSCIFDNSITNCYSWSISKDGYFIFGGAYPMKDGQTRFTTLKEKMSAFQFQFGKAVKSEKCTVLFPSRWQDFVCGKDNAFLIGEAAGFISASSLEGISYALDSADILRAVLLKQPEKLNTAYWRATRKLRLKLFGKIVKSRCLTAPALRKWIMRSGMAHIPQLKD
ncbi:oxidoreductase [Escherichia coli]|uniref:Oxidoreductase n=1 Tax=Escherichia coli TaxID=562 RepID=A0A377B640_ECOLX|nr:oxidoreductase [Escherichia coli]